MNVATDGTKFSFVTAVSSAILQQKQSLITDILVDGKKERRGFVLPSPQTSGTWGQQQTYARQKAEEIYTNFFTNRLISKKEKDAKEN